MQNFQKTTLSIQYTNTSIQSANAIAPSMILGMRDLKPFTSNQKQRGDLFHLYYNSVE